MTELSEILSEYQKNIKFREEFNVNPVKACDAAGFTLTPELLAKIEATLKLRDGKSKNEKLDDRISK